MARCTALSDAILRRVWPALGDEDDISFALEVRAEIGRTDLEVRLPSALVIFEAKRDWLLPTTTQLTQYVSRIHRSGAGALVSLSQASTALAESQLPTEIQGVPPVMHLPWRDVLADIAAARAVCRGRERIWLEELHTYLLEVIRMRTVADSLVYSVVLSEDRPGGEGTPDIPRVRHRSPLLLPPLRRRGDGPPTRRTSWRSGGPAPCNASTGSCTPMSSPPPSATDTRTYPRTTPATARTPCTTSVPDFRRSTPPSPQWRRHLPVVTALGPARPAADRTVTQGRDRGGTRALQDGWATT